MPATAPTAAAPAEVRQMLHDLENLATFAAIKARVLRDLWPAQQGMADRLAAAAADLAGIAGQARMVAAYAALRQEPTP